MRASHPRPNVVCSEEGRLPANWSIHKGRYKLQDKCLSTTQPPANFVFQEDFISTSSPTGLSRVFLFARFFVLVFDSLWLSHPQSAFLHRSERAANSTWNIRRADLYANRIYTGT